ncbi:MAG: hypothetical protein KDK33_18295 [Leptospiraceae bacterium]|nr:hypothetical protein [Leptospiraceae bacterium]
MPTKVGRVAPIPISAILMLLYNAGAFWIMAVNAFLSLESITRRKNPSSMSGLALLSPLFFPFQLDRTLIAKRFYTFRT